ncbi:MAG: helix-hairpin-helix domain-containing protein [Elusimicrobia bacterium]|nr:helix-hairpin-helix domain-containing protein [Elusimicrobiota bacterium]
MLNKTIKSVFVAGLLVFLFSPSAQARRIALVDVNLSTVQEFTNLPGVSSELAQEIIKFRELNNYFEKIEELMEVEGVTKKLFDNISPYLVVTSGALIRADEIIEELEIMAEEEEEYFLEFDVDISRLELYRTNPLDLNTAVYSQLLELPGVDAEKAKKIIELRKELRGFKSVNDIREIMGDYHFERMSPFIAILDEEDVAELSGDIRLLGTLEYPFDPYYFNLPEREQKSMEMEMRHRLRYGNKLEFGFQAARKASAHFKPSYDGAREINYGNFNSYFLGSRYLLVRNVGPADTFILGSYRLDFFRPMTRTRTLKGLRIDDRSRTNSGFYGAAAEIRPGDWEITAFTSQKQFAIKPDDINEQDGSVGIRERTFYYTGNYPLYQEPYLKETVYGGIVRRPLTSSLTLGLGGYTKSYDKVLDHEEDATSFRGDKINIFDLEAEYSVRNYRLLADFGLSSYHTFDPVLDAAGNRDWSAGREWSWETGNAMRLTLLSNHERANFWIYYWRVDHDYFDLLGEGYDATYNGRNEERYSIGGRIAPKKGMSTQVDIIYQEPIKHFKPSAGDFSHRTTIKARQSWDVTKKFLLRYTGTFRESMAFRSQAVRYSPRTEYSHRMEIVHRASDRIRFRTVLRKSQDYYSEISDLRDHDTESGNYFEVRYRPTNPLVILSRVFMQESGHGIGFKTRPVFTFSKGGKL